MFLREMIYDDLGEKGKFVHQKAGFLHPLYPKMSCITPKNQL